MVFSFGGIFYQTRGQTSSGNAGISRLRAHGVICYNSTSPSGAADDAQAPEGGQRKENKMKFDRDFILRHAGVIRGGEFAFQMRGIPVGGATDS